MRIRHADRFWYENYKMNGYVPELEKDGWIDGLFKSKKMHVYYYIYIYIYIIIYKDVLARININGAGVHMTFVQQCSLISVFQHKLLKL